MALKRDDGHYVIEREEARRSATLIQVAAVAGALVCLALAASLHAPINRQRQDLQLAIQSDIYKELPPEYGWISAFGGTFRSIAIHYLWKRMEDLKEEGKYYESHQLARWICTMEPRFTEVWSFQAWNMSYNISVATHTPQERWQWVYNGIRLLRDEGIPNNERLMRLYRELTWIWFHKVGDRVDEYQNFYKRKWAATMENVLGPPPPGATDEKLLEGLKQIADAPRSLEELIAQRPKVAELVDRLLSLGIDVKVGTSNDKVVHPLEELFFNRYSRWLRDKDVAAFQGKPAETDRPFQDFIAASAGDDFDALLAHLRSKVLREQYKMDPAFMLSMCGKLGTAKPIALDWRTPWTQAMYWSIYGISKGEQLRTAKEIDRMNTDRVLLYGLQNLARMGRYAFRRNFDNPFKSFLEMGPDLRFVEAMHNKYIELGKKYAEPNENVENRTSDMLRDGHVNFLEEAIMNLYFAGRVDEARSYLDYLANHYPDPNTGKVKPDYLKPVDEFMNARIGDIIDTQPSTIALIGSLLYRGYIALASGNSDEYETAIRNAAYIYKRYQEESISSEMNRLRLPEFPAMRARALMVFLADTEMPIYVRAFVWRSEQEEIKYYCYHLDMPGLLRALAEECAEQKLDAKLAFPEPANVQGWLKEHPAPTLQEDLGKKPEQPAQPG